MGEAAQFYLEVRPRAVRLIGVELSMAKTELLQAIDDLECTTLSGPSESHEESTEVEESSLTTEDKEKFKAAVNKCLNFISNLQIGEKDTIASDVRSLISVFEDLFLATDGSGHVSILDPDSPSYKQKNSKLQGLFKRSKDLMTTLKEGVNR
jgi:hypothetical protein